VTRRALSLLILALAFPCVALAAQRPVPGSADDELVQMGRAIPGFGGMFYDAQGYPNVYLRDPEAKASRVALKSLGQGEVRVLRGDYDFAQLVEWKETLVPALLGQPGVVFIDADESRNRVVVGIDAAQVKSLDTGRLDKALALQGVPRGAVLYQPAPVIHELVKTVDVAAVDKRGAVNGSLLNAIRPVPGGVQIIFLDLPLAYACTSGFNAYMGGTFGFVTNSHCTVKRGTVDDTQYAQGNDPFGAPVATEIVDPGYFTGDPCPNGYQCRYSDSSFAKYNTTSLGSLGKLAKTASRGLLQGSTTLKPATSRFSISGTASALQGQTVNKMGVTTGWTYGPVTATCAAVGVTGSQPPIGMLCQNIVKAGSDHGDSGSPVFLWTTGNSVKLLGLLWGGGTLNGDTVFVYSPIGSIQQELGTLRVR
jgi:hypothetical protein